MLTMLGSRRRCCDGITRRETLKAGALSALGGFGLTQYLQAQEDSPAAVQPGPSLQLNRETTKRHCDLLKMRLPRRSTEDPIYSAISPWH